MNSQPVLSQTERLADERTFSNVVHSSYKPKELTPEEIKNNKEYWTIEEILEEIQITRQSIYRKIRLGEFPRSTKTRGKRLLFKSARIKEWIKQNPRFIKPKGFNTMTEAVEITLDDQQKQRITEAAMALNRERYGFNIEHFIVDAVMHYVERIEDRMAS